MKEHKPLNYNISLPEGKTIESMSRDDLRVARDTFMAWCNDQHEDLKNTPRAFRAAFNTLIQCENENSAFDPLDREAALKTLSEGFSFTGHEAPRKRLHRGKGNHPTLRVKEQSDDYISF